MDWGRGSWVTRCRFFRDSDAEADVLWYPCLPGAPRLGFPTAIVNSMFDRDELYGPTGKWEGPGEVYDAGRRSRVPRMKPAATGAHVCGTRDDFERGAIYDPLIVPRLYRPDGLPTCCVPGRGLLLGVPVRGRQSGGLLIYAPARSGVRGLLLTDGSRRPSAGLLLYRAPFQGCDTYSVSPALVGSGDLTRVVTSGPLWWNGVGGGTAMVGFEPESLTAWFVTAGSSAEYLYSSDTWWDGQGTRTFSRLGGPGPSTVDVTCTD